jgi:hypothetical protein
MEDFPMDECPVCKAREKAEKEAGLAFTRYNEKLYSFLSPMVAVAMVIVIGVQFYKGAEIVSFMVPLVFLVLYGALTYQLWNKRKSQKENKSS